MRDAVKKGELFLSLPDCWRRSAWLDTPSTVRREVRLPPLRSMKKEMGNGKHSTEGKVPEGRLPSTTLQKSNRASGREASFPRMAEDVNAAFFYRTTISAATKLMEMFTRHCGEIGCDRHSVESLCMCRGPNEISPSPRRHRTARMSATTVDAHLKPNRMESTSESHAHQQLNAIPETRDLIRRRRCFGRFTDDAGKRGVFPNQRMPTTMELFGNYRVAREVATERDIVHAHGTSLSAAGKQRRRLLEDRPIATDNRMIEDLCSDRGLLISPARNLRPPLPAST